MRYIVNALWLILTSTGAYAQVRPSQPVAPLSNPQFSGTVKTDLLQILGAGSTGDVSSMTAASGSTLARLLQQRFGEIASVRDFGAKCDGITDDGSAFNAAIAARRIVFVPVAGCSAPYLINTTVVVPPSKGFIGQINGASAATGAGSILTTAGVDTFRTDGGGTSFEKLSIAHNGPSGSAIRNAKGTLMRVLDSNFQATNAASTDPVIYASGSSMSVERNVIGNNRSASAPAIDYDRTAANGISIEGYVTRNQISGTGAGVIVHTSDGSKRPEGVHINMNTLVNKGDYQLKVNAVLSLNALANTFDLAAERAVVFDPIAEGIDTVSLAGNWFANEAPEGGVQGDCLEFVNEANAANGTSSGILNVNVVGNQFHFCRDGIYGSNALAGLTLSANNFTSISRYAFNFEQSYRVAISGNTVQNIGTSASYGRLVDGVLGGPFNVTGNIFTGAVGGADALLTTKANQNKFIIANNSGIYNQYPDISHRIALTTAGTTVPANVSVVRLVQTGTVASATITLPTAASDLQQVSIENGAGAVTALTFSPAVSGWTNGSALPAYARTSLRFDKTAGAWVRYAPN